MMVDGKWKYYVTSSVLISSNKMRRKTLLFLSFSFLMRKKERVWQIIPSNKIWSLINLLAQQFFSKIKTTNKETRRKLNNFKRWKGTTFKYTYAIILKFYFFGKIVNVYMIYVSLNALLMFAFAFNFVFPFVSSFLNCQKMWSFFMFLICNTSIN